MIICNPDCAGNYFAPRLAGVYVLVHKDSRCVCVVMIVQVIFAPRLAGVYVAQLSLSCGPVDSSLSVTGKLPVMVTLQAVAENPSVEVHKHSYLPVAVELLVTSYLNLGYF